MRYLYNLAGVYPPFIEIEVTTRTRCPFNCVMCESSYWDEPNRDMTYEQFEHILNEFPKLKWIGLTGIGEAFLNREFKKMIDLCKSRNIMIEIYDLMFFDNTEYLLDRNVDVILVSLDAATEETYKKIRRNGDWERSIFNTKKLFRLAKERAAEGKPCPMILLHFIITTLNKDEMIPFLYLANVLADGYPVGVQFTNILHSKKFPQAAEVRYDVTPEDVSRTQAVADELGVYITWGQNTWDKKPEMRHCIEWAMPFIFADGTVIPCCAQNLQFDRALQRRTSMGNIFEKPFKEIWKTSYVDLRRKFRKGELPACCVDCALYESPVKYI